MARFGAFFISCQPFPFDPAESRYFCSIYSASEDELLTGIPRYIVAHDVALGADTIHLLDDVTFAFPSFNAGHAKRLIVEKLEAKGAAFVGVGMGLVFDEGSLDSNLRLSVSTPEKRDHVRRGISFVGGGAKDIHATNIQVADLNALNAVLAVVKWKKICDFYRDPSASIVS